MADNIVAAPPTKRSRTNNNVASLSSSSSSSSFSSSSPPFVPPPAAPGLLIPAARYGDDATVASALRNPLVDPNMTDEHGSTALIEAVSAGHDNTSVLKVLLADERVDPNYFSNRGGRTALMHAVRQMHTSAVALLLADDRMDPDIAGERGRTALIELATLSWAPANVDLPSDAAASDRPLSVARLLLADKRVDPNIADQEGHTALYYTCSVNTRLRNPMPFLRLLLADERTIRTRPDDGGGYYDAALAWVNRQGTDADAAPEEFLPAAESGDDATVASALRNPHTDANLIDESGRTALLLAAQQGHVSAVKVLLADDRVNPNVTISSSLDCHQGWTALMLAIEYKRDSVVKLLLANEHVDSNMTDDHDGRTAIWCASRRNKESRLSVLKLLLADDRTIRTRPTDGGDNYDAALACYNRQGTEAEAAPEEFLPAAMRGDDATVASALRNPLLDPNMADVNGWTALMWAARHKHDSVAKVLLADERVDPNIADKWETTALFLAGRRMNVSMLRLLLSDDRTIRTRPDDDYSDYYDAALAWVNRQRTDAEAAPEELIPAARYGDDATVASALRNPLVDPNMTDHLGNTALIEAVSAPSAAAEREGGASVLTLLLADKRVNPNIANQYGTTALFEAANLRHQDMLELLLEDHRTIRIRPPENVPGWTPWNARTNYDAALRAVKRRRNSRFKGLVRAMVVLRRLRLRAALTVYAPGGAGFEAAAASFFAAAAAAVGEGMDGDGALGGGADPPSAADAMADAAGQQPPPEVVLEAVAASFLAAAEAAAAAGAEGVEGGAGAGVGDCAGANGAKGTACACCVGGDLPPQCTPS